VAVGSLPAAFSASAKTAWPAWGNTAVDFQAPRSEELLRRGIVFKSFEHRSGGTERRKVLKTVFDFIVKKFIEEGLFFFVSFLLEGQKK
jgi:hypothetical protein